jgi:hypothetical protein
LSISSSREQKIIDICLALGGKVYYSGTGARSYQKEKDFIDKGLELRYSNYTVFRYPQLWGDFQANVTILDYLMNCGYNWEKVLLNQH